MSGRAIACAAAIALAAACGRNGGSARPVRPEEAPEAPRREPFAVTTGEQISAIARDATHLYWADSLGVHRRPLGGPDAGAARRVTDDRAAAIAVVAMAVHGDRVYLSDGAGVLAVPTGGGAVEPVAPDLGTSIGQGLSGIVAMTTTAGGDLVVATADAIARVRTGAAPLVLATGQVRVTSLAVDGEHVYWTDYGEDPAAAPIPQPYYGADTSLSADGVGAVRRAPLSGGPITELATAQRGPDGIAVSGGRIWWTCDRGPGVQSVAAGEEPRVEVKGRSRGLALDGAGLVVRGALGLVAERTAGDTLEMRMTGGAWQAMPGPILLDQGWIYLVAMHPYEGRQALLALPRQDEAIEVVASVAGALLRVRARDGALTWVESSRSGNGLSIWHRARGAAAERFPTQASYIMELAAGDGDAYFSEDVAISRVTAAGVRPFATSSGYPIALTVHRNHVFWIDGNQLMAKKRRGGQPFVFAQSPTYSSGDLGADLVFDDDFAYTSALGGGVAIHRIDERGRITLLYDGTSSNIYPGRDLVAIGDELFFWATLGSGGYAVYRLDGDGTATPIGTIGGSDRYVQELVAGGGFLYLTVGTADQIEVIRIDPAGGETIPVLRWQQYVGDPGVLAADDTGVYVAIEPYDAVIRIGHGAPALAPPIPAR